MTTIELKSRIHYVTSLKNAWVASLFSTNNEVQYAIIRPNGLVEYYDGYILEGVYEERNAVIVKNRKEKKIGYLDENGEIHPESISCISTYNGMIRYQQIQKGCLFNEVFSIPKDKIGFLVITKEKHHLILTLPHVFNSEYSMKLSFLQNGAVLALQGGSKFVVLMDNMQTQ